MRQLISPPTITKTATQARNGMVDLISELDKLDGYDLPHNIDDVICTADQIATILKTAHQIAYAYRNAIPEPQDAMHTYDASGRADLRCIRRHALTSFRAGYTAYSYFSDIPRMTRIARPNATRCPFGVRPHDKDHAGAHKTDRR